MKPQFYRECYVSVEANSRHLMLSKNTIQNRYKRSDTSGVVPESINLASRKTADNHIIFQSDASNPINGRPIVVLGDVGVGKTSFFENLYFSLDKQDQDKTYFLFINLGEKATLADDIKTSVIRQIPDVLLSKYSIDIDSDEFCKAIYHYDLIRFDKSPSGQLKSVNPEEYERAKIEFLIEKHNQKDLHLHAALAHLCHGRKKSIVLVIDNADQRSFEHQQEAFLIAQELAATRSILVFISLRPSTFYKSKIGGTLSGYQNRVLTIASPPAELVLEKRIIFALKVAGGKVHTTLLQDIRLNLSSIVLFLEATPRSIKSNASIRQLLDNITGGNIRSVVELLSAFCGSPNVDSEKIVQIEQRSGKYQVPLHEFTKHALLGDYAYFNQDSSQVACNVYDLFTSDSREHFLECLIISLIISTPGVRDNDGFISGEVIQRELLKLGFIEDQTTLHLRRLANRKLIETPHSHFREIDQSDSPRVEITLFRATTVGVYHIRHWIGTFSFLDAVCIDTPIFDDTARSGISKNINSFAIEDRYSRAYAFREYLESQWYAANISFPYFDLPDLFRRQQDTFDHVLRAFPNRQ